MPTDLRPAAVEVEKGGNRIYARYQLTTPAQPIALALDEARHRLFVDMRRPSSFNILDMDSGRPIQTIDTIDGVESMYFDPSLKRIYMTALDNYLQVIQELDADHYKTIARLFTGHHAGTSQWVPSMNLLCVAVPPADGQAAEIWLFQPKP